MTITKSITELFKPNGNPTRNVILINKFIQIALLLLVWVYMAGPLVPKPWPILQEFIDLCSTGGLLQEVYTSTKLCFHAGALAILVSVFTAYLTILPVGRPAGFLFRKLRFLPMAGLTFMFGLWTGGGYDQKLYMLSYGMSVFFVDTMINVVQGVTQNAYNHARTIFGGNEWKVVYERVILGTAHQMIDAIRQNFAIAWTMLVAVEGLVRVDGGAGAMILNQNKHLQVDSMFAVMLALILVGMLIDYAFVLIRDILCPYAKLTTQSKR